MGVPVPPARKGDSLPPDERALHEVRKMLEPLVERVEAHSGRIDELHTRLDAVEETTREAKDAATSARRTELAVRDLTSSVSELSGHVVKAISENATQNVDIAQLKAIAKAQGELAGNEAGKESGEMAAGQIVKRYGVRGGLVVILLSTLPAWLPMAIKACNAAPHDPKTEQGE